MECIPLPVIFISNTQNIFNKQKIYFCNSNIHAYDPLRCYIIYIYIYYIYIIYIYTHTKTITIYNKGTQNVLQSECWGNISMIL